MYNHKEVEKKWQEYWEKNKIFRTENDFSKPKWYSLDMFPYPSGAGLHVGHPEGFTANDILARYKHALGYNVLHPMGWDAFGLPAENYAIKTGTHPRITTNNNIHTFKSQLKKLGFSYDWDREIDTTDPDYYKWTQWIFLKLFEHGLAYEQDLPINYCPSCKTGLANEEVLNDFTCDRCGTKVEKKKIRQWVLAITKYADRLLNDVDKLDWPEGIKDMQRNWIGKSEGCEFELKKYISNKPLAIILHGWRDDENDVSRHWQNWLKDNLEKLGYEVELPDLPNPSKPDLEKQLEFLKQYENRLTKDSVVVGHSMGGFLAMHFVERLNKKINKLICVAPCFNDLINYVDWSSSEGWEIGSRSMKINYNPEKINHNCEDWKVFLSKNDTGILYPLAKEHFDTIGVTHIDIENAGHFCGRDGFNIFPALLEEIVDSIRVYTTRVDTVFGMTYAVLAPDHKDVNDYITDQYRKECEAYIKKANSMSDQDRTADDKEKTGVFTGSYVINPFNGEKVSLWIADYVLGNYGTGAVMAVPAHDIRDFEFAKKYDLEIKQSILHKDIDESNIKQLLSVWNEINDYANKNNIKVFLLGGLVAPFYNGVIYRNHADLDIAIEGGKQKQILDYLSTKGAIIKNTDEDSYFIEDKKVSVEFIEIGKNKSLYDGEEFIFGYDKFETNERILWGISGKILSINYFVKLKNNNIKIRNVIKDIEDINKISNGAFTEYGILINSGEFTGLTSEEAKVKMTELAEKNGFGTKKINYKLRDWLYSRQRYWGEPIPLIHVENNDVEKLINFNFYYENVIDSIISGVKTVETRALNPEEPNRYFGDIKVGDVVTFTDKTKDIKYLVKINEVKTWKNIEELYKDKENLEKVLSEKKEVSLEELKKLYTYTPDYVERIEKNGLIGFSFEVISKIYDGLYGKIICDYNLPLKLPEVENYEPAGDGNSPLVKVPDFVNIKLANNLSGKRETNTMPQWGGSCWYYLRFMDPKNSSELVNSEVEKYWGQVDSYVGGAEHAVLHLLYARFWHKFLFDIKVVSSDEPFFRLRNQGLILAHAFQRKNGGLIANDLVEEKNGKYYEIANGEELNRIISKMSKSLKNVINPDDIVEEFGADSLRLYEMYMAEFKDTAPWDTKGIVGVKRFLEKSERLFTSEAKISTEDDNNTLKLLHKTIKKVEEDIENYKFNTGIAAMMILVNNGLPKDEKLEKEWKNTFVRLLHPFAPHLAEELWENIGEKKSVFYSVWPKYDENLVKDDVITIGVQVLGKLRGEIEIAVDEDEKQVLEKARNNENVKKWLDGKVIVKEIYVKGKIVNIVVR